MERPTSPYLVHGFYDRALAEGRHRDIVGGRWEETGRLQLALLQARGLRPHHRLIDIGAGALRLGCKVVPFLDPGNYWATDASRALMLRGRSVELQEPGRLSEDRLVQDHDFSFPNLPDDLDFAIAFGVFTHLPQATTCHALAQAARRWPDLGMFMFTVFVAPDATAAQPVRQPDGVVTHPDRPPYHVTETDLYAMGASAGLRLTRCPDRLPRGQVLWQAQPSSGSPA
jgi:hypothetical protein